MFLLPINWRDWYLVKDPLWKWSVRAQIYLCYVIGFEVTRYRSRQEIKEKCDTWWKDSIRKERSVNDKQAFKGEGLKSGLCDVWSSMYTTAGDWDYLQCITSPTHITIIWHFPLKHGSYCLWIVLVFLYFSSILMLASYLLGQYILRVVYHCWQWHFHYLGTNSHLQIFACLLTNNASWELANSCRETI